ncbi:hypothetical protein MACH26_30370 [Planctobacterium marinum]|uniref:Uncharacterized protein n=1 Tax=Planctobacterium marinum TaxID=1631968 RepID=A0AA48KQ94_9ALTE|nr:hypothetical protein MACH26_30370 [Planctobacterium marinum]
MQISYEFVPHWKEKLVCKCAQGNFILDYAMGSPTVYLPAKNRWETVAPDWSHEHWESIYTQLSDWCSKNKVALAIDAYAEHKLETE